MSFNRFFNRCAIAPSPIIKCTTIELWLSMRQKCSFETKHMLYNIYSYFATVCCQIASLWNTFSNHTETKSNNKPLWHPLPKLGNQELTSKPKDRFLSYHTCSHSKGPMLTLEFLPQRVVSRAVTQVTHPSIAGVVVALDSDWSTHCWLGAASSPIGRSLLVNITILLRKYQFYSMQPNIGSNCDIHLSSDILNVILSASPQIVWLLLVTFFLDCVWYLVGLCQDTFNCLAIWLRLQNRST